MAIDTQETASQTPLRASGDRRRGVAGMLVGAVERSAVLVLLVIFIVVFTALEPDTFPIAANIRTVLQSQAITGLIALAAVLPLTTGRFDLSTGTILTLTSVVTAKLMADQNVPLLLAVVLGLLLGAVVGMVNGFFVAYMGVNSLVVTLATSTALSGFIDIYSKGQLIVTGIPSQLAGLGLNQIAGVPLLFAIMIVVAGVVWYGMVLTPWGRRLTAIGSNESSAVFVGIKVQRSIFVSFALAGLLGGAAGILQIGAQGSANPNFGGISVMLPALAGAFLGATAFTPGRYNVPGTIVGLFVVAVLVNGMALVGANPSLQPIVNGAAVLAAVTVSTVLRRRRSGEQIA